MPACTAPATPARTGDEHSGPERPSISPDRRDPDRRAANTRAPDSRDLDTRDLDTRDPDLRHPLGTVRIRPLAPADDAPLRRVFAGLSPRSRFLRYQRAAPMLSSSMIRALVDLRPGSHVALAAELDGEPVGIVRWIRHPANPNSGVRGDTDLGAGSTAVSSGADSAHAEIALEVIDAVQGRGIGRRLTEAAARSASDAGIDSFTLWVDGRHGRLRDRLLSLGARRTPDDPDQFRVTPAALLGDAGGGRPSSK